MRLSSPDRPETTPASARHLRAGARPGLAAGLLVAALSLGLAGCGDAEGDEAAAAPPSVSSPTSTSPTVDATQPAPRVAAAVVAPGDFSGDAVTAFGQGPVEEAYAELAVFLGSTSFNEKYLVDASTTSAADYQAPKEHMTTTMAAAYDAIVDGAWAGDPQAAENLNAMIFYSLDAQDGVDWASTGPMVTGHSIYGPAASIDSEGRLQLVLEQKADVHVVMHGAPYVTTMSKVITASLVPGNAAGHRWSIDALSGTWHATKAVPETGS